MQLPRSGVKLPHSGVKPHFVQPVQLWFSVEELVGY